MSTPDYMKLWHAALAREANLERELEQLRRNAAPAPDVDPLPILDALAAAHREISDARAYIREMEDTISHLRKIARVRTSLQRDVAESTRKRQLDAKAEALRDAATDLERNPPSLDIWGKSLPGHREAIRRLREIASELADKPDQEAAQ